MDADGDLDLVHGPPRKGPFRPFVFRNDGRGQFSPWSDAHFPPLPYDYGNIKTADVNGDGMLDLALASHLRGLTVLIAEAPGSFAPWAGGLAYAAPAPGIEPVFTSRELALVDWNRDRRIDLVAFNEGPSRMATTPRSNDPFAVYLNRGGFWDLLPGEATSGIFGDGLAVGDLNADGHPDAVLGTAVADVREVIRLGRGDGWTARAIRSLPPQAALTAVRTHDLDQQRGDEIVAGLRYIEGENYCTALDLIHWSETRDSSTTLWSEVSRHPIKTIAVSDFDADGKSEILAVRDRGDVILFSGNDEGFTMAAQLQPPAWLAGCTAYDAVAADLDGDLHPEVVISFAGETTLAGRSCDSGGGFLVLAIERITSPSR